MAKFLEGDHLNAAIGDILKGAEKSLVLISPYIKLYDRFESILKSKQNNNELEIIIVFGKNKDDLTKSMKEAEYNFFTRFPNIQIRHESRLHAKYYANEKEAILTSMNLYSFSQEHNIEAGMRINDSDASDYFNDIVIPQSQLIFQKKPPVISRAQSTNPLLKLTKEAATKSDAAPTGHCIRTGKSIPFNTKRPFTEEAYKSWAQFSNPDYPEKYCHFSGEASQGDTCSARPILRKNWEKAKAMHK